MPAGIDSTTLIGVVAFLLSALLLDAFDISMPRGDSIGVAGAIVAASVHVWVRDGHC